MGCVRGPLAVVGLLWLFHSKVSFIVFRVNVWDHILITICRKIPIVAPLDSSGSMNLYGVKIVKFRGV